VTQDVGVTRGETHCAHRLVWLNENDLSGRSLVFDDFHK
jgi:hypothetical protein